MMDQALWIEEARRATIDLKKLTFSGLTRLTDDGIKLEKAASVDCNLKLHVSFSKLLADLKKRQSAVKSLDKRIQALLGPGYADCEILNTQYLILLRIRSHGRASLLRSQLNIEDSQSFHLFMF